LKEEALNRTIWRAGFGPVVRQTAWINDWMYILHRLLSCSPSSSNIPHSPTVFDLS
jgi:hypothetical protein